MPVQDVNIPLLKQVVEWAEEQAQLPPQECEWDQRWFIMKDPDERALQIWQDHGIEVPAAECRTTFCIAGYIAFALGERRDSDPWSSARRALGLSDLQANALFAFDNTIEDIRRIAEDIAGRKL